MDPITYALKVNLAFAVFLAVYWYTMRRETWFAARRAWLLIAALISMLLPLLPWPTSSAVVISFNLPVVEVRPFTSDIDRISLPEVLVLVHILISVFLIFRLAWRAVGTLRLQGLQEHEAASFFGRIHVPPQADPRDEQAIRAHEQVHARQLHSADVILYQLLAAIWWSVPSWWIAFRELRVVHEHAADAEACHVHPHYQELLLARALGIQRSTLFNSFHSSIKTRIAMLNNTRTSHQGRMRILAAIPALALAIALVSWQATPLRIASAAGQTATGWDTPPEFPGGAAAMMNYFGSNVKYPELVKNAGIEGTVFVEFMVKTNGSIEDAVVKRGVHPALDAEALRVINDMPAWKPATKDGRSIDAQMIQPIRFVAEKPEE